MLLFFIFKECHGCHHLIFFNCATLNYFVSRDILNVGFKVNSFYKGEKKLSKRKYVIT